MSSFRRLSGAGIVIAADDWTALGVTLTVVAGVVVVLAVVAPVLVFGILRLPNRWRALATVLLLFPLMVPPTVAGFYYLQSPLPAFTLPSVIVVVSMMALPLATLPLLTAATSVPSDMIEAARCLGLSPTDVFRRVIVPTCWGGYVTGLATAAAHAAGSFGAVLMVGGNLPGRTRTLSIAVYEHGQNLDPSAAHRSAILLLSVSATSIFLTSWWARSRQPVVRT